MKSNNIFLLIPLVFLFQVLFAPADLTILDERDGINQTASDVLNAYPLSNISGGSSVKHSKKNPFKIFFNDCTGAGHFSNALVQSVPHFLPSLVSEFTQYQNHARAPPVA